MASARHRDLVAPPDLRVLDFLYQRFDQLSGPDFLPEARTRGYRAAVTSAKIFVLDERAQQSGFPAIPCREEQKDFP
ncbi:hypothetical protein [Rhodococcus sp. NPDC127528]|uniref:hypothetical protein n=1 Tax=unclassified Rhodococcus (in: high G+C Gram-positive bacteria) TaxID=192944 RepID=UPI00362601FD